jgi:hypothetical protein
LRPLPQLVLALALAIPAGPTIATAARASDAVEAALPAEPRGALTGGLHAEPAGALTEPWPAASGGALAEDAPALLREALARRYDCDLEARLRLVLFGRDGSRRTRELRSVSKRLDGRTHTLGRLLAPEHLRGMAVLSIEARGRAADVFVYLPSLGRTRRVGGRQRSERFLGSDLTWADLERHRAEDHAVLGAERDTSAGEPALRIRTRRRDEAGRVEFVVALRDLAILRMDVVGPGDHALRSLSMPREAMLASGDLRVPGRIEARDLRRGTRTRVDVLELRFDPEVDARVFSTVTLESGRPLVP